MNAENTKQDESSAEQATPREADDTILTAEAAANGAETSEDGANACGSEADVSDVDAAGSDESEVEGLRLQLQQREDALLRLQAELENLRKRASGDVENPHKFGVEKLVWSCCRSRTAWSWVWRLKKARTSTHCAKEFS